MSSEEKVADHLDRREKFRRMNSKEKSMPGEAAQNRLAQVFRFLKELNELRNPVARDLSGYPEVLKLDTWPSHPCIVVRRGDRTEDSETDGEGEMEPLIRIKRARLTQCPMPPEALDGWLKPGWQAADAEAEVLRSRNFVDQDEQTTTIAFEDGVQRVEALRHLGIDPHEVVGRRTAGHRGTKSIRAGSFALDNDAA